MADFYADSSALVKRHVQLEKLGFVQEGYFRENYYDPVEARFIDMAVYSLLKVMGWVGRICRRGGTRPIPDQIL